MNPDSFRSLALQIEAEVAKSIVGQPEVIRNVLTAIILGGHVLLEGNPGLGKTSLIRTFSQVLHLDFSRIQFTPDLMPADIVGTDILDDSSTGRSFRFQPGPIFANLVLADEVNRATPKTQSAMLEAMQEKRVTVAKHTYDLPAPFFVLATQNPIEMEGTYPLPEAQLDRFLLKVNVPFPTTSEMVLIMERTTGQNTPTVSKVADGEQLLAMGELARQVPVASHISEAIASLVVATHPNHPSAKPLVKKYIRYGASPRGAQALTLAAKVRALLQGRYNVSEDDVKAVAKACLRHRLLPNFEAQAEGISTDAVIDELVA
ncbi:MAG TPA: MoxR family ATPase [Anaerolineales bacterium]|nr:MoxR family ATPase [Anaerolineales bacterium]